MNEKHQQFYKVALQMIHERGFKAMTMRDLAKALNCDVSNLYNYIESKQSLIIDVLREIDQYFQDHIDQIIQSRYNPIDKLKLVVRMYVELSVERPLELSLLTYEWRNLRGEDLTNFVERKKEFEKKVALIVGQAIECGQVKPLSKELASHLFLSSLRLLFNNSTAYSKQVNKIELERQINQYIFRGLEA